MTATKVVDPGTEMQETQSFSERIRGEFPAFDPAINPTTPIFFDNPGGTQVPRQVVEAFTDCLIRKNANLGGAFATSKAADEVYLKAHQDMARLFNASSTGEVIFGQNMTTLTLQMSRALGPRFSPGDEIILTQMEHDANYTPWMLMARDHGLEVKILPFEQDRFEFDLSRLDDLLSPRTKMLCINHASNMTGTINDVKTACAKAKSVGALVYIDSVQFAPHGVIDVQDIGCDFLVCSPYKFFGPHMGVLWGRESLLSDITPYKLKAASNDLPDRFETGTLNHEGMAGISAVMDYFNWIGETFAEQSHHQPYTKFDDQRRNFCAGMDFLFEYEMPLTLRLINGLKEFKGVKIHGITDPQAMHRRVPTVSFTVEQCQPRSIASYLAERGIQVWDGHNYALAPMEALGLLDRGGAVRIGLAHYNTLEEVDTVLKVMEECLHEVKNK